jgi:hypothetical protein
VSAACDCCGTTTLPLRGFPGLCEPCIAAAVPVDIGVEAVTQIDVKAYVDDGLDSDGHRIEQEFWWWSVMFRGTSGGERYANESDARAGALEYLRKLRERIDLTLAEIDRGGR